MTNPIRSRSHFEVVELVVVSTGSGVELRLQTLGAATVPLAQNRPAASRRPDGER